MKQFVPMFMISGCLLAQTPSFEAAAIKPSNQPPGHSSSRARTGMLVVSNESLRQLIRDAYRLNDNQIEGGPKWMDTDRFDINARAAGAAEGPEIMKMLQDLLADRFKLASHRETRSLPGFALVVARGGIKIRPADPGESIVGRHSSGGHASMEVEHAKLAEIVEALSRSLGAPVVDETGVADVFSFKLEWSPENLSANPSTSAGADNPSLFTVLPEKLGLKLESRKVPTEVFVIDRAEKPHMD